MTAAPPADRDLLDRFLRTRDEAAFAELVRRHGPLVWGACRRLLPDPADAEDAFQASFLVLVQRANRLTGQAAVGPWLYRVAAWTARNVRRRNARALARRRPLSPAEADPAPAGHDLRADLDAALLALPEKYRTPLVLCHLQGWTRRDAAAEIGCPEGTLSSLLSRGLDRLRHALRSHDPARLLSGAGVGVPAVLAANTVRAAVDGKLVAAGLVGSSVSQLLEGVAHMLWAKKATAAAAALCVVFGTGVGVGVSVRPAPGLAGDGPAGDPVSFVTAAPADLDALKAELAAAEEVLKAAEEAVALARQKLELTEKAAKRGQVAQAELLQEQLSVTRYVENMANAKAARASVLSRLKAADQPAKRGLFETVSDKPAPADLGVLKAELAAAEVILKAAAQGLEAAKNKQELFRRQADTGSVTKAELLQDELTVARFKENVAVADGKRQVLLAKLRAAEQQIKEKPAALPAKPAADELHRREVEAAAMIAPTRERVRALELALSNTDQIKRDLDSARKEYEWAEKQLADIRKQRAAAAPAAGPQLAVTGNFLFHLTVSPKDAQWPYLVKEYGPDGHGVGNTAFDGPSSLAKYLARLAKDPAVKGVGVRILAAKDLPSDRVLEVARLVKAAGLPFVPTAAEDAKPAEETSQPRFERDDLRKFGAKPSPVGADPKQREALIQWLGQNPPSADPNTVKLLKEYTDALDKKATASAQQRRDAEAAKLQADIEALTRQLKELQAKPADPLLPKPAPKR